MLSMIFSSLGRNCVFGVEILKGSDSAAIGYLPWCDYYSFLEKNAQNRSQSTKAVNLN